MEFVFRYGGSAGRVLVSCVPNDDPVGLGKREGDRGIPYCTATIEFAGRGYWALMGWVQLVRYSGNATHGREFEVDPFDLFADSPASAYIHFRVHSIIFIASSSICGCSTYYRS